MDKIIKIYCEGKRGSHDYDIIEKVMSGMLDSVQIEPIGGVRGAASIIQFKETEIVKSDFKIFFRDRDFDLQIPENPILEQDKSRSYIYYSYRNTIENYLFSPDWLFSFLKTKHLCSRYSIFSEQEMCSLMIEAAHTIRHYQAIRHAMGKMRSNETNFGTRWTEKSGELPASLDLEHCKQQALAKISYAKSVTDTWTTDGFEAIYTSFFNQFNDDFISNMGFLVYFQGKDYAAALKRLLDDFPLKDYYKYAKACFDYKRFPDLVALRNLIKQNL